MTNKTTATALTLAVTTALFATSPAVTHRAEAGPTFFGKGEAMDPRDRRRHPDTSLTVGQKIETEEFTRLRDVSRYDLQTQPSWHYYRDGSQILCVDAATDRLITILDIPQSLSRASSN